MSRSFAALLLLAFRAALVAQDAAVPPLEGTVIRRLGNTLWRSVVELHAPAFSHASDLLARPFACASYVGHKIASGAAS